MKKKMIIGTIVGITALLFWAPWTGDGDVLSRKILEKESVQKELNTLTAEHSCSEGDLTNCCDGLSTKWAPFGKMVKYCEYGSWYAPFWE